MCALSIYFRQGEGGVGGAGRASKLRAMNLSKIIKRENHRENPARQCVCFHFCFVSMPIFALEWRTSSVMLVKYTLRIYIACIGRLLTGTGL